MVDDADEARAAVANARYPPEGERGIAGSRATAYGQRFEEYVTTANDGVVVIAQIETRSGLENVEEIAAVDGIDALFVGPADLSGSLDVFAEWDSDRLADAMSRVVEAARGAGIAAGTLCVSPEDIPRRVEAGFDFLIVGKDTAFFARAATEAKERGASRGERRRGRLPSVSLLPSCLDTSASPERVAVGSRHKPDRGVGLAWSTSR
jgi:2-keto-3-deoxy-L-rhamnonate aldolase RhmA